MNGGTNLVGLPINLCSMGFEKPSIGPQAHTKISPSTWEAVLMKFIQNYHKNLCFSAGPSRSLGMTVRQTDKSPSSLEEPANERSIRSSTST